MYYVVVVVIPLSIAVLSFLLTRKRDQVRWHIVRSLVKSLPYQYVYLFLVYFLEREGYIESNWQFYSFGFFLIPISVILIVVHGVFNSKGAADH